MMMVVVVVVVMMMMVRVGMLRWLLFFRPAYVLVFLAVLAADRGRVEAFFEVGVVAFELG